MGAGIRGDGARGAFLFCAAPICLSLALFCVSLASCGLEEMTILEPPVETLHEPQYNSEYDTRYFEFRTASNSSSGAFQYLGTSVYYKIYNSTSTMNSAINAIESRNDSTTGSTAAELLMNTYGYVPLFLDGNETDPLIGSGDDGKRIYIRLSNYQFGNPKLTSTDTRNAAKIIVGFSGDTSAAGSGTPVRHVLGPKSRRKNFDFGRSSAVSYPAVYEHSVKPEDGDDDTQYSSSFTKDSTWYVDLFVFAQGRDASYSKSYSKVLHLGCVPIDDSAEDN